MIQEWGRLVLPHFHLSLSSFIFIFHFHLSLSPSLSFIDLCCCVSTHAGIPAHYLLVYLTLSSVSHRLGDPRLGASVIKRTLWIPSHLRAVQLWMPTILVEFDHYLEHFLVIHSPESNLQCKSNSILPNCFVALLIKLHRVVSSGFKPRFTSLVSDPSLVRRADSQNTKWRANAFLHSHLIFIVLTSPTIATHIILFGIRFDRKSRLATLSHWLASSLLLKRGMNLGFSLSTFTETERSKQALLPHLINFSLLLPVFHTEPTVEMKGTRWARILISSLCLCPQLTKPWSPVQRTHFCCAPLCCWAWSTYTT